jgi:integrase
VSLQKFKDKKGNEYAHLYYHSTSQTVYVVARVGGRVRKASLQTDDFNTARGLILPTLKMIGAEVETGRKENLLIKDFFEEMRKEKIAEEVKESTLTKIDTVWKKSIEPFWGHLNSDKVDDAKVTEFILWHREKRPGLQFINVFKYLGNIFRLMQKRGHLSIVPKLEIPKTEQKHHAKKKGRIATNEEMKAIISVLPEPVNLITRLALSTGMRQMEIGQMELSRIKTSGESLVFCLDTDDTKTGLAREIPLPPGLSSEVSALIEMLRGETYLFPRPKDSTKPIYSQSIDKAWQRAKLDAKIVGRLRFHDLRHTCATKMAQLGINPVVACTMLGMILKTYQQR